MSRSFFSAVVILWAIAATIAYCTGPKASEIEIASQKRRLEVQDQFIQYLQKRRHQEDSLFIIWADDRLERAKMQRQYPKVSKRLK